MVIKLIALAAGMASGGIVLYIAYKLGKWIERTFGEDKAIHKPFEYHEQNRIDDIY
jgi:hypothetical protein